MVIVEMTLQECRDLVTRTGFGHLGCTRNNEPYVVPIYFACDADHLYGFSTFGRKIEWMRANPRVCVQVEEIASQFSWASVIINGRYEELEDTREHNPERQQAYTLLEKRALWWQTAKASRQLHSQPVSTIFYCIHMDAMTGHRASPDGRIESDRPLIRVSD